MALQEFTHTTNVGFSALPIELQEEICKYLDGNSLLRACCVCRKWNSTISQLEIVWRQACIQEGVGINPSNKCSLKAQYIKCHQLLHSLQSGNALQYKNFTSECFCNGVDDFAYCNNVILAGVGNELRTWRISDFKPVGKFNIIEPISVMKVSSDGQVLAMGHKDGTISLWFLHFLPQYNEYAASLINTFHGHSSSITSIDIDTKNDIICSGSDQKVLIWQLSSCQIVTSLEVDEALTEASFQKEQDQILLLIITSKSLILYRDLHFAYMELPVQGPTFSLRAYIQGKSLICLCDGQTLIKLNIPSKMEIWRISFDCKTAVLIAVGSRFGLVTLWQRKQASQKLVIIDLLNGTIIATYSIPYCREHVVVGDTAWLDGLAFQKPGSFLAGAWCMGVMQQYGRVSDILYVIKWSEDITL